MAFALSKILWILAAPGTLLALLLASGCFLAWRADSRTRKTGERLILAALAVVLILAVFPVGTWFLTPLENRFALTTLPQRADGIIVLGGDEQAALSAKRGQPIALDSMRRYAMAVHLAKRYPSARIVFTGGSGRLFPDAPMAESDVAKAFFADMGLDPARIVFETEARNTYENATFAAARVKPTPSQTWLLVTSAWHMPRAMACFRRQGWPVVAAPTGYFTPGTYSLLPVFAFSHQLHALTMAVHEYIGLVSYRLMGRTSSVWPDASS